MAPASRGGTPQLSFRVGTLAPHLDARVGTTPTEQTRAQVAQRDLGRYYELLQAGLREVRRLGLTEAQISAVCDALNGTLVLWHAPAGPDQGAEPRMTAESLHGVIALELADADQLAGLGQKWGINVRTLIDRLGELSPLGLWALVDAVERWWHHPGLNTLSSRDLHVAVGLLPGEGGA